MSTAINPPNPPQIFPNTIQQQQTGLLHNEEDPISIFTLNANGLYKTNSPNFTEFKLTDDLKQRINEASIICISDTHLNSFEKERLADTFGEHTLFATETQRKRAGTAILLKKDVWESEPKHQTIESGFTRERSRQEDGPRFNILTVKRKKSNEESIIAAVYGPTASNKLDFMRKFIVKIREHKRRALNATIVIAGDLNLHLDRIQQTTLAQRELMAAMEDLNLIDAYRTVNPHKKGYTYWGKKGNNPTRIDYIILSQDLMTTEMSASTICGSSLQTDHDAVLVSMTDSIPQKKGLRGPKPFNDNLLKQKGFTQKLEKNIIDRLKQTQTGVKKPEDSLKTIQSNQPQHVKTIEEIYNIIKEVIKPLEKKTELNFKTKMKKQRSKLQKQYEQIVNSNKQISHQESKLELIRQKLATIESKIAKTRMRSLKIKMITEGDKATPFFLNNFKDKMRRNKISEIQLSENDENSVTRNEEKIEEHIVSHFKTVFQGKDDHESPENFFQKYNINTRQISSRTRKQLEVTPDREEILAAIRNLNSSAAPGYDAVTTKLIKHLAVLIPDIISEAILKEMEGQEGRTLMTRLRKIILIEKRETPKKTIKKLRPISLLSVFYKTISTIISTRLKGAMLEDPILPANQDAYLPGRSSCLSVALINDVLSKAQVEKSNLFLVNTDLAAAFDTVSRKLIYFILMKMDFPQKYINWLKNLIEGNWISLQVNGVEAARLNHQIGLGQGDPLSALLFIVSIIPVILAIKMANQTCGFNTVPNEVEHNYRSQIKGTYFSDDGINIAVSTKEVKFILNVYNDYSPCSNLKVNVSKTKITHNHNISDSDKRDLLDMGIRQENISDFFEFLGYQLRANRESDDFLSIKNIADKIKRKINKSMDRWKLRRQNIHGRATIANTMVNSMFSYYLMAILPTKQEKLGELQKTIDKTFTVGQSYTKGDQRYLPVKLGGLGIPHINTKTLASTSFWIKQLISFDHVRPHLRPPALFLPVQILQHWDITIRDLFNATANDIKILSHYIRERTGSRLWVNVLHNILEIRNTFENTTQWTQNTPTLWVLQEEKKKNRELTILKKKITQTRTSLQEYIKRNKSITILDQRWRNLARAKPRFGDLIKKNSSSPIDEDKLREILATSVDSTQSNNELARYTHLRIQEQAHRFKIVNHPKLRTMDILEDLFIGDYGAIKSKSPSAKIYRTRIFKMAKESISADLKWEKRGFKINKLEIVQCAKNINDLKIANKHKSTCMRFLLCTYLNGKQLQRLGHASSDICRHCSTEIFSAEHYTTECVVSVFIRQYIQEKLSVKNKRKVIFDPVAQLLTLTDPQLCRTITDKKERTQAASWLHSATVRAWNLYHTAKFFPSEHLIIEIIKEAYYEVKLVATQNYAHPENFKLKKIMSFSRPLNLKSLEARKCEWKRCHQNPSEHRLDRLFRQTQTSQNTVFEIEDDERILINFLKNSAEYERNSLAKIAIREFKRKEEENERRLQELLED